MSVDRQRDDRGRFVVKHGMKRTRLYRVWCAMKERCENPHNKSFPRYGGRGIHVCNEWKNSFERFRDWALKSGYSEGSTIARIDFTMGYEPENCRWVTTEVQNRNYSRNHMITYKGETKCMSDWADHFGIRRATVLYRIKAGKELDEVFEKIDGRAKRWKKTTS